MKIFLHRICGKTAEPPVPILLRRCTAEEAPAVYALQNEVRAAMPHPEQFVPDTLENITAYVRKDLCIGAWQGSRLGGYLIVRFCGQSEHNYAAFMDVPRTEWEHWANADSAIVHADFRGNGLHRRAGYSRQYKRENEHYEGLLKKTLRAKPECLFATLFFLLL